MLRQRQTGRSAGSAACSLPSSPVMACRPCLGRYAAWRYGVNKPNCDAWPPRHVAITLQETHATFRPGSRRLRAVSLTPGFSPHAEGSCLIRMGNTEVLCAASVKGRVPPFLRNSRHGLGHCGIRHDAHARRAVRPGDPHRRPHAAPLSPPRPFVNTDRMAGVRCSGRSRAQPTCRTTRQLHGRRMCLACLQPPFRSAVLISSAKKT